MNFEADYTLQVIDTDGRPLDFIDMRRVRTFTYTRSLNMLNIGNCTLTVPANDFALSYYDKLDIVLNVYRNDVWDAGFFIRSWSRFERDNAEYIVLSGDALDDLIIRRKIRIEDDPTGAGGFSTKLGYGDILMRDYVLNQCINPAFDSDRIITGLSAGTVWGIGASNIFQRREENSDLKDCLIDISAESNIDFHIITDGSGFNFVFQPYLAGRDLTVDDDYPTKEILVISPDLLRAVKPKLSSNRKNERTFLYMQGQGPDDDRFSYPYSEGLENDSIINRREHIVDANQNRDIDISAFDAQGAAFMREQRQREKFEFSLDLTRPELVYGESVFLGDRLTVAWGTFQRNYRITGIDIALSDREKVEIKITDL